MIVNTIKAKIDTAVAAKSENSDDIQISVETYCLPCKRAGRCILNINRCSNIVIGCKICENQETFPIQKLIWERLDYLTITYGYVKMLEWDIIYGGVVRGYNRWTI